jgi:prephenate dehydratase
MRVSYQGIPGSYSDIVARQLFPAAEYIGCPSFAEALKRLDAGAVDCAVIPVTNILAGPVTNALELLRKGDYAVSGTHWQPIHHCLLALPEAKPEDIRTVHSHWQALKQCAANIEKLGLKAVEEPDTASSARDIAAAKDTAKAAIASASAAKAYGLAILRESFEDKPDNKTLFFAIVRGEGIREKLAEFGL